MAHADSKHPCFKYIRPATCSIEKRFEADKTLSYLENHKIEKQQSCLEDSSKYADQLEEIFPSLPEHSKNAFCYIKKIFVFETKDFGGAAGYSFNTEQYTSYRELMNNTVTSEEIKPDGFILYLDKFSRFDLGESSSSYYSRIMKYFFGGDFHDYSIDSSLPIYHYTGSGPEPLSLYNTLVHEIGHFAEFVGCYTNAFDRDPTSGVLSIRPGSWRSFSWLMAPDGSNISAITDPILVPASQKGWNFDVAHSKDIFAALADSTFASFYAITNAKEDFAEHYRSVHAGNPYFVKFGGETIFDNSMQRPENFHNKNNFIQSIPDDIFSKVVDLPFVSVTGDEAARFIGGNLPYCQYADLENYFRP